MEKKFFIVCIILYMIFSGVNLSGEKKITFKEIERVRLEFNDIVFYSIWQSIKIKDGFVSILTESEKGGRYFLVKFSNEGKILAVYKQYGSGPGDISRINSIADTGNTILIPERTLSYVHEFSYDLKFIRDYRIKKGGNIILIGDYVAIWSVNTPGQKDTDKKYMSALYDLKNFNFKKYAFEITEIPALVQDWGNICKLDHNSYAGIYSTEYQIRIYDRELNFKKNLLNNTPNYISKYSPFNGNPRNVNNEIVKWMESWSRMHELFYADGKLILRYATGKDMFIDIFDKNGKPLAQNIKQNKENYLAFTDGNYFWKYEIKIEGEVEKYWLVKTKLIID